MCVAVFLSAAFNLKSSHLAAFNANGLPISMNTSLAIHVLFLLAFLSVCTAPGVVQRAATGMPTAALQVLRHAFYKPALAIHLSWTIVVERMRETLS